MVPATVTYQPCSRTVTFWYVPLMNGSGSCSGSSYLRQVELHHLPRIKSHKTVEIKDFLNYFCLMMEGSGSVYLTNGSVSGRHKTRIRNTMRKKKRQQIIDVPAGT
jgi:hypothetical protein